MTKFIDVSSETQKEKKETVFISYFCKCDGLTDALLKPKHFNIVKYLGKCSIEGDVFAAYGDDEIYIYAGIKGDEFES